MHYTAKVSCGLVKPIGQKSRLREVFPEIPDCPTGRTLYETKIYRGKTDPFHSNKEKFRDFFSKNSSSFRRGQSTGFFGEKIFLFPLAFFYIR